MSDPDLTGLVDKVAESVNRYDRAAAKAYVAATLAALPEDDKMVEAVARALWPSAFDPGEPPLEAATYRNVARVVLCALSGGAS